MTRRTRQQKSSSRTPQIGLLTLVLLVAAAVISQLTGVDILGTLTGAPTWTPLPPTAIADIPGPATLETLEVQKGFGARKDFWQVYFNAAPVSSNSADYNNGAEMPLVAAIGQVQATLDIAAFEWNSPALTEAVIAAHNRGVRVRMVADNEHTIEDSDTTITALVNAGIPIVYDQKSSLMHNKFMILDGSTVWTGSMNYTQNGIYRNNNNMVALRLRRAAETYTAEFEEMFINREFSRKTSPVMDAAFTADSTPVQILFAPEGNIIPVLVETLNAAESSIKFMAFSFTLTELSDVILQRAEDGVKVEGVFETIGSDTSFSQMTPLRCAGLDIRIDGNPYRLHHKVFIIDDEIVVFGSFNFSSSAANTNDENIVLIGDADLAAQFVAEFERVQARAQQPTVNCR
ncbi:MAG: phospholipase [Chloroflexi bacterium]|jgi:phosphatidylserine/phosphatidylglycerophosphate/cardiolipin synthase-like enzyme|nr:MAG: phospholipase D/transphosphatidylase [Chloroflexi bacterium OLB13]MBC6957562.1 phospholipase [Chloroflexota bacterium]MBV6434998.1 Cardiolipin synthase [Anaerolineae bacterium]MDL1914751.1 phospholipase [Anaerolineae bacterium CFX4]MBW7877914.1 phospholipase [Anaerolineae bacterium]